MTAPRAAEAQQAWALQTLGYEFRDPALCLAALTHRSAGVPHNERLEFLGDAVLNCAVAHLLYERYREADEGALSRLRASLVSGEMLARIAAEHGVGDHLRLGPGEIRSGGFRRASILADAVEALVGAIMVDGGFAPAARAAGRLIGPYVDGLPPVADLKDAKTRLQEALQARSMALPEYDLVAVHGEAHAQVFEVQCQVRVLDLTTCGKGTSRRRAEQEAAGRMLALLPAGTRA